MTWDPHYIEFHVHDRELFERFARLFHALKDAKDQLNDAEAEDYEQLRQTLFDWKKWLPYFDAKSRRAFFWGPDEIEVALGDEHSTVEQPSPEAWHFGSMLAAFANGEYRFTECVYLQDNKAQLRFLSFAWPYGGVGSMMMLVSAFGFNIIGFDDGFGYRKPGETPRLDRQSE